MLNCVVDERYDDALKEAKEVDEFIKHTTLSEEELAYQKPFLGVPFSTKNCIAVKGTYNHFIHKIKVFVKIVFIDYFFRNAQYSRLVRT